MTEEQKKVYEGLMGYYEKYKGGNFIPAQLVAYMEPVFEALGMRETVVPGEKQNILVVRDDAAGDFVLFSPFLRELRRLYPAAHITFFGSDRNEELARCCPYIDDLLVKDLEKEAGSFWEMYPILARQALEFVPYHFAMSFGCCPGAKPAGVLLMYMGGARRRISYDQNRLDRKGHMIDFGWNSFLDIAVPILPLVQSDVDRDLYILEYLLQLPVANRELELWTLASDREEAKKALAPLLSKKNIKRIYTVMPCTSQRFREWPVERFIELLKVIMKREKDVGLVMLGSKDDAPRAEMLAKAFPGRALALAGKLPFRVSAEVVGITDKYIGNDTVLMHFAAAKQVPVLVVFPYPAEIRLHYLSIPIRFQPYHVPAVIVLPAKAAGPECQIRPSTGCAVEERPHCILNVTVEKMLEGYKYLNKCIEERRMAAMVLK